MSDSLVPPEGFLASGQLTPNKIATQFAELDLPEPTGFAFPSHNAHQTRQEPAAQPIQTSGHARRQSNADDVMKELAKMRLPDPERIGQSVDNRRRESVSEQLSARLANMDFPTPERIQQVDGRRGDASEQLSAKWAGMDFPQPERIFGGAGEGKGGVDAADWDNVKLDTEYEIPEAVRRGSVVGITSPVIDSTPSFARGHRKGQPSLSSVNEEGKSGSA